ncbi:MAG: glutamyl-tRNA reductase, partial [Calditrichaeota bacterium]
MEILLVGLSHKTTPVKIRERLAFPQNRVGDALMQLRQMNGDPQADLVEVVILSTCNRVEIYAVSRNAERAARRVISFLSDFHQIHLEEFQDTLYTRMNQSAVDHLFRVASGIDSMVIGEGQIQGQVKQALDLAHQYGASGPILSALFANALHVGKRARTETEINQHSLSISGAAVNLVRSQFPDLSEVNIVIVGLGEMSLIAIKSLLHAGAKEVTVVNRSRERIQNIVQQFAVRALPFDRLEQSVTEADVVICSTGAPHAILTFDAMQQVMKQRTDRPLLIVDIAVPRDVEPEVGTLPH